jgi:hypothetical protein
MGVARIVGVILVTSMLAGCTTIFGAGTVPKARIGYNEAITRSANEQLLLNLVRLRYRDSTTFLELSSVVTQYGYSGLLAADMSGEFRSIENATGNLGTGASYEERPTIAYEPLQGSEFAQRMLAPIPPETIVLLSQSGWSIERLLLCCVERLNNLINGPSASGPTPERFPDNSAFREAAAILRELQSQDILSVGMKADAEGTPHPALAFDTPHANALGLDADVTKVKRLIGVTPRVDTFRIADNLSARKADQISIKGRSLLGVLYALSHTVASPPDDAEEGLTTVSLTEDGRPASWRQDFLSDTFGVRTSEQRPDGAFVKVAYRDHWFWIPDNDLNTKTTFSLLTYLTALQSAVGEGATPLLTLSAGG